MIETGPLIDGALPRTGKERCRVLLDYIDGLLNDYDPIDQNYFDQLRVRRDELASETERSRKLDLWDGWIIEVEDDLVDLINDLLPDAYICTLGEPNPGDVIIRYKEDGED